MKLVIQHCWLDVLKLLACRVHSCSMSELRTKSAGAGALDSLELSRCVANKLSDKPNLLLSETVSATDGAIDADWR
jgi:hypothetical protein